MDQRTLLCLMGSNSSFLFTPNHIEIVKKLLQSPPKLDVPAQGHIGSHENTLQR